MLSLEFQGLFLDEFLAVADHYADIVLIDFYAHEVVGAAVVDCGADTLTFSIPLWSAQSVKYFSRTFIVDFSFA